ncbi:AAA family ATPase [Mesorhizobium sp. M0871]|uniref:AAA family ATPase n=1 Tax=Mesorhizobium sp. M0871 TaxID=2957017 RepID=UPI0033391E82
MELVSFRVTNFRSISDSGDVKVSRITALLGRNESGKSTLLLAVRSLNPAEGFTALNKIKDFPRSRRLEECTDDTRVVDTSWVLSKAEQAELATMLPRASGITEISIGRNYGGKRWVNLASRLQPLGYDKAAVSSKIRKIGPAVLAVVENVADDRKEDLKTAADAFETSAAALDDGLAWAKVASPAVKALRIALAAAGTELSDKQDALLDEIDDLAIAVGQDEQKQQQVRDWFVGKLPVFMFLDEYPSMSGHQNVAEYLQRKEAGGLTPADEQFEKLCKVAGLNATTLQSLSGTDAETRNQLANRASAVVTGEIKRLWKDRPLKVRFSPDAQFLDTFVSDPNAVYDVEVNLDERSRGFKWFFAFYITFAADTNGGKAENAILLLDEPGLYLHAKSQADLLTLFKSGFKNQILYSTHSPFMVPTDSLDAIRTVSIDEEHGTTVSNDPAGDSRTLFPIQAALGYDLAQSLFVGPNNLVVEGVTDFWMLSSISAYLRDNGKTSLNPELTITPAGGAQKVSYMVALLTSENLKVLVLLDEEPQARNTSLELLKTRLMKEDGLVFASEGSGTAEADIEDLLDPATYERLVRDAYVKELKGKTLTLNPNIPRIAKRVRRRPESPEYRIFQDQANSTAAFRNGHESYRDC